MSSIEHPLNRAGQISDDIRVGGYLNAAAGQKRQDGRLLLLEESKGWLAKVMDDGPECEQCDENATPKDIIVGPPTSFDKRNGFATEA